MTGTSLVVTPHPLTLQGQRIYHEMPEGGDQHLPALLVPGERLSTFLARHDVLAGQQWVVSIGGVDVRELDWPRIKPKHGQLIEARRVAQEQAVQIGAVVALSYFTLGVGGMAAGSFMGASGAAGWALAGVANLAGGMVINKLLGPKPMAQKPMALANNTNSPSYSLQAGKNRARQFEPMGLVLGEPYMVPDLAAQPYTLFVNGEQCLWQVFHCGINCASVNTLRIGQTPLENYVGVQVHRDGFDSGNTGLPVLSTNVDTVSGALLEGAGGYVQRTSSTQTIVLAVDLEAQLFAVDGQSGAYVANTVVLSMEYRAVGGGAWLALPLNGDLNVTLTNATSKPLRVTYQRTVTAGQYEVRLKKLTADQSSGSATNQLQWSSLKSYQLDEGNYKGQARLGVQVQASGQLNGFLDEVNCVGVAKPMPFWNGATWTTATSRANGLSNPGALMLLLVRGIRDVDGKLIAGLGLADDEIDIEGFKGFMDFCRVKGFTFDLFLQENMAIGELLESIATAGMGSRSEHTGKLGVIWFSDEQPVEGVLNMATMKPKTFSVEYSVQATADEIEYQYFDRARANTWKSVRVLAPGVTVPQRTARLTLQGVTDEAQAAVLARFSMGQNTYQRKTVSCDVDLEHMTFRRGTKMAVSHDLTQWGYGGRLQACSNAAGMLTLTLDDVIPSASPTGAVSRYMGFRLAGEAQFRILPVAAFSGSTRVVTLAAAWPSGVAVPGSSEDNPAHDTVWIYDFKATPGQRMRVSDIVPRGNLDGAQVQLVPDTPEFWTYVWNGAYTAPPNTSLLGQGLPVVLGARVTEQLARQGNTLYTELTLTFDVQGNYDHADLWGAVAGGQVQRLATTRNQALSWRGGLAETWTLELRTYSATRLGAPYALTYTVVGMTVPPADVAGLSAGIVQNGILLTWTQPADVDYAETEIRIGTSFAAGTLLTRKASTSHLLDFQSTGTRQFWAKHFDTSGNPSATATGYTLTIAAPAAVQALALTVGNTGLQATWGMPATSAGSQPLDRFELSWNSNFADLIDAKKATSASFDWRPAGAHTLYVRAVDVAGNLGAASSSTLTIAAPSPAQQLTLTFGTANIEATWQAPAVSANRQPLSRVELSWGPAFTTIVDGKLATTAAFGWLPAGTHTLYARYVDVAGNVGTVNQATLQVLPPVQPTMTAVETQINAVTLRWQDSKTSQPIRKYAMYYAEAGTPLASATLYGSAGADSRSDVLFFRSSGGKVAYLVPEDVAGNIGPARQIDVTITMPNDFVLATEYYEDWQASEITNGSIINGANGQIILPANNGRTWGQRLSNNGWTTAQQKIDAGFPIVVQPVPSSGKHIEQRDMGKVLATAVIRATPSLQSSVPGFVATVRIRASVGASSSTWQGWLTGEAATFSNFRYIEVEYSVTSDGKGFVVLDDLYVKVEINEVTESAVLTLSSSDVGGTLYTCTKGFVDVRTAVASPLSSNNIARLNCIIDDGTVPARVYVQAWDTSNNRTSGTVSLYLSGV
jgi:hypothetical protein